MHSNYCFTNICSLRLTIPLPLLILSPPTLLAVPHSTNSHLWLSKFIRFHPKKRVSCRPVRLAFPIYYIRPPFIQPRIWFTYQTLNFLYISVSYLQRVRGVCSGLFSFSGIRFYGTSMQHGVGQGFPFYQRATSLLRLLGSTWGSIESPEDYVWLHERNAEMEARK
jgi:hypothetical protein